MPVAKATLSLSRIHRPEGLCSLRQLLTDLASPTEAVDLAAVALGGAAFVLEVNVLRSLALLGEFEALCAAGLGFKVQGLRNGGGATHLTEQEDFDLILASLVANDEFVANTHIAGGLGRVRVRGDTVEFAGLRRQRAGFEEASGP